jgi:hypothetical protein
MNLFLTVALLSGLDLFFVKDSPNLLARVEPAGQAQAIIIKYSFSGADWKSVLAEPAGQYYDAVIAPPESLNVVGLFFEDDNGRVYDNSGMLYIYEVRKSPKMLIAISINDIETVLKQARKKIVLKKHVDEALALLDYAAELLADIPFIKGSELEIKKDILASELNELRALSGR